MSNILSDYNPKDFTDNFFGPEDERKETCIHCGTKSYSIHFNDGRCPNCQKQNKPGKSKIEKRIRIFQNIVLIILATVSLVVGKILIDIFSK